LRVLADRVVLIKTDADRQYYERQMRMNELHRSNTTFDHNTCNIQMMHSIYETVSVKLCIEHSFIISKN
jgi:hypothetical protein